ncbi:FAD-dependent thymidylate synthase [Lachnospiraceae bacterium 62-35]
MDGKVTIINFNANAASIVSAAGRISTTKGCADEIYLDSCNKEQEKNISLIKKILASGHESVLEHISVNLSFNNVSVFVEQFLIEFRLASFTVKSRRYVDFGNMGFILPDFSRYENEIRGDLKQKYEQHMEYLFEEYNFFAEAGIPKEDARFVLPYSFKSNFYCTVNARELIKIMNEMVNGRGRHYPELVMLGNSLFQQCEEKLPYLKREKKPADVREALKGLYPKLDECDEDRGQKDELVSLLYGTEHSEQMICKAAALNQGISGWYHCNISDSRQQKAMIKEILKQSRRRELEQVHFTVCFNKVSLAGVTHLVRHRMQSIIVPEYVNICQYDRYVLPESIVKAGLTKRYQNIYEKTRKVADELNAQGLLQPDQVYLLLSGMTIPVITTMNANELCTFIQLRTCNRAQWEIKACADALLKVLRNEYPVLFSMYGPTCYMTGECPEGKMTCGRMQEMCKLYSDGLEE